MPATILHVNFYLDGIRDVSETLFQLWLSSHAPAMAHRGNLDARSVFPEGVWVRKSGSFPVSSHHSASQASRASHGRLEVLLTSSSSHLGSNSLSLLRAQALCFADSVPRAFDCRFNLSRRVRPGWNDLAQFPYWGASLSVLSTFSLTSASKEHRMSGHACVLLRVGFSPCVSHLDGIRDVSKALFQLWLSSHVPAMAL